MKIIQIENYGHFQAKPVNIHHYEDGTADYFNFAFDELTEINNLKEFRKQLRDNGFAYTDMTRFQ